MGRADSVRSIKQPVESTAWIGLGSNMGDSTAHLTEARSALACLPVGRLISYSSLYATAPIGDEDQAPFLNAVCCLSTQLPPPVLLGALHGIEQVAGRRRGSRRFGPRPLDLDLLLIDDLRINSPCLTLPHPRMAARRFVLQPLAELAPELRIPGIGRVTDTLAGCLDQECRLVGPWKPLNS